MITQIYGFSLYNARNMQSEGQGRILAVDWGSKRIGLALSDPTRTLAKALDPFLHTSRQADAEEILWAAKEFEATEILMGVTYDDQNALTPSGRSAAKLAEEIRRFTSVPVKEWDEGGSSKAALLSMLRTGIPKKKRQLPIDSRSAAIFLQHYLDAINENAHENC